MKKTSYSQPLNLKYTKEYLATIKTLVKNRDWKNLEKFLGITPEYIEEQVRQARWLTWEEVSQELGWDEKKPRAGRKAFAKRLPKKQGKSA